MVFRLSRQSRKVIGLDLNDEVLEYSRMKKRKLQIENIEFVSKDVNDAGFLSGTHFDYVVLSMVLHQFSVTETNQVLVSALGVAEFIIIADFTCPLPGNMIGWGARMIERMAGGEHYLNFQNYQKQGGLSYFLNCHRMAILKKKIGGLGVIQVIKTTPETV